MFEQGGSASVAQELAQARDQLDYLRQRVSEAAAHAPHHDASGWSGLAAFAYQHALDALGRELAAATELLRSAADLASAAVWELGGHA
jgi:hypothetical protein